MLLKINYLLFFVMRVMRAQKCILVTNIATFVRKYKKNRVSYPTRFSLF